MGLRKGVEDIVIVKFMLNIGLFVWKYVVGIMWCCVLVFFIIIVICSC